MSPEPPFDATGIARRQFPTSRKGYDPAAVRAFLHELSDLVGRLQRSEVHERERAERAENRARLAEQLDEHRLVELLGEETARVLDAARAAAADIRSHAEEQASRMIREAQAKARGIVEQADRDATTHRVEILAEADALRREAEEEVARRRAEGQVVADELRRTAEQQHARLVAEGERARTEAEAAAEQIRASAREQGRHLVGEAQAVRERMLGDLSRRRRVAREQLERLNGARERLLAAYAVVKRTVDEATTELTVALPEAKAASEMAMRRVSDEPEESVEVLEAELSVARMSGMDDDLAAATVSDEELDAMLRELAEEEAAQAAAAAAAEAEAQAREAEAQEREAEAQAREAEAEAQEREAEAQAREAEAQTQAGDAERAADEADTAQASGRGRQPGEVAATPPAEDVDDASHPVAPAGDPAAPGAAGPTDGRRPGGGPAGDRPRAPMSDAEKWGIRLPRPRPSAAQRADTPGNPAPVPPPPPAPVAATEEGETGAYVDELFARIRSERPGRESGDPTSAPTAAAATTGPEGGSVAVAVRPDAAPAPRAGRSGAATDAEPDEPEVDEPVDPAARLLTDRDTRLAAVERDLGRSLKRVLADEQNEVLDRLRRGGTVEFADVLGPADEHVDRYAIAATAHLDGAAARGAALAGGEGAGSCDELAAALARLLVDPLRARIERSFVDSDGDLEEVSERLRALYREWKANHIGNAVRHYTATAYAGGAYEAAPAGEPLQWLVDSSCDACPDCDDNALAGPVLKGESYPTGDRCAPAHPDCRCLVVPVALLDTD